VAHCENKIEIKFPIIGDPDRSISMKYGMIDPGNSDEQALPLTIRAVFIINPEDKLMLSLNYPACVGRNMDEIVRCVEALQLSYQKSIAVSLIIMLPTVVIQVLPITQLVKSFFFHHILTHLLRRIAILH
jgi:hypothetical protein